MCNSNMKVKIRNMFFYLHLTLLGCIDNGPKMAKIKIELCYFTHVFRGIIQGIE